MTARLHVMLGAGGVGKTTLAAAYALGLAAGGRRVGLLGIDPSRRLQDALGVALADDDAAIPGAGALRAAIVHPHQAIERWVAEACSDPEAARRLARNPFFVALGDRLATATDVLAAARIGEWAERDPALDDLVVDTAPGLAALEFLRAPRQLEALVRGRTIGLLRAAAGSSGGWLRGTWLGTRRLLAALAGIAGTRMVIDIAEFFADVRAPLSRMIERVESARRWLAGDAGELVLVTAPHDAAARAAAALAAALRAEQLAPRAVIVNRCWPPGLSRELAGVAPPPGAAAFVAHARARVDAQARVLAAAPAWAPTVISLASSQAIVDGDRAALVELGIVLRDELAPGHLAVRSAS